MASNEEDDIFSILGESKTTSEDVRRGFKDLYGESWEEWFEANSGSGTQGEADEKWRRGQAAREHAEKMGYAARREHGLEDPRMFELAQELYGISTGQQESSGRRAARRSLEQLAGGQRGAAAAGSGFRAGARTMAGERAAQTVETVGGSELSERSAAEREATKNQLDELLMQGKARAETKKLQLQQIAFQQEQADSSMWGDVLGGILGAVGVVVGGVLTMGAGPAAVAAGIGAGASISSGLGKAGGRWAG